jgi:hypothetical protein
MVNPEAREVIGEGSAERVLEFDNRWVFRQLTGSRRFIDPVQFLVGNQISSEPPWE